MYFRFPGKLEGLGKNNEPVKRMVSGRSEKEVTSILPHIVRDLYSDDPIIGKFLSFVRKNRKIIFSYLEDTSVNTTNNVAEHHFSMRSAF